MNQKIEVIENKEVGEKNVSFLTQKETTGE